MTENMVSRHQSHEHMNPRRKVSGQSVDDCYLILFLLVAVAVVVAVVAVIIRIIIIR